jgi:putative redox protein
MSTLPATATEDTNKKSANVIVRGNAAGFLQEVTTGKHHLRADEPVDVGGNDVAPGPYDYLLIALGACTSMTVGLYARRRQIPLENITVSLSHSRIHATDCEDCETKEGMLDRIETHIELSGSLSPEQRAKLMEIAEKCPVHRTLKSEINIRLHAVNSK